jgi:PKD domain-containing protein
LKKIFAFLSFSLIFLFIPFKAQADTTQLTVGTISQDLNVPLSPNVFQADQNGYTYCFLYQNDVYSGDTFPANPDGSCGIGNSSFTNFLAENNIPVYFELVYINNETSQETVLGQSNTFTFPFYQSDTNCNYSISDPHRTGGSAEINIQNLCLQQDVVGSAIPDSYYYSYTTETGLHENLTSSYDATESEFSWAPDSSTGNILYKVDLVFSCGGTPCGDLPLYNNPQGFPIIIPPQVNPLSGGTINSGDTYSESGSFANDTDSSNWTATVDYGDGSGAQPLILFGQSFNLSHMYTLAGTYTVTVSITGTDDGLTGTGIATVVVNDTPPQINSLSGGTINQGNTYSENGSFSDPDSTSWTATIDYGDGSGAQPLTLNSDNTFSLSHQYANSGTYTINVNVTDDQGETGTTVGTVAVNPPAPKTLSPIADTYIKSNSKGQNEGSSPILSLQDTGNTRALVQFDESQIQAAVGNSSNYTATLQFTIAATGNNGSTGRQVDIDRMIQNWAEGNGYIAGNSTPNRGTGLGADWYCARTQI